MLSHEGVDGTWKVKIYGQKKYIYFLYFFSFSSSFFCFWFSGILLKIKGKLELNIYLDIRFYLKCLALFLSFWKTATGNVL